MQSSLPQTDPCGNRGVDLAKVREQRRRLAQQDGDADPAPPRKFTPSVGYLEAADRRLAATSGAHVLEDDFSPSWWPAINRWRRTVERRRASAARSRPQQLSTAQPTARPQRARSRRRTTAAHARAASSDGSPTDPPATKLSLTLTELRPFIEAMADLLIARLSKREVH